MVVYAGQGDTLRSMALLWRSAGSSPESPLPAHSGGPGPKQGLSVDQIVTAAIAIADADGMAALSMRTVGERLGRSAMALYTYVPSKQELVDLMYDHVLGELPASYNLDAGWRPALTTWTRDTLAFYLRHPWVLQVSHARPVLGPNEFVVSETIVRILRETGLPASELRGVVALLFNFVRGAAQTIAEVRQAPAATGVEDEEWWFARSALLQEVAPDFVERFPMSVWLESDEPTGSDDVPYLERRVNETFEEGLLVVLGGIDALIARAARC